jgi:PAS domain S-box-containing protein
MLVSIPDHDPHSAELDELLTSTLDNMSDAFFVVDRDWRFTFLNRQAEQLLGRGREALLGRNIWDEFPTAIGSVFQCEYSRALADNVTVAFEGVFELLDLHVSVRAYPSRLGLAVHFIDVTESRRAAAALRASEANSARWPKRCRKSSGRRRRTAGASTSTGSGRTTPG